MRALRIRRLTTVAFMTLIPLLGASLADGQPAGASAECQGMEAVRSSIDELTSVIREQIKGEARHEKLQLAIAYLQFRSRRIESLEQDLRRLEERRSNVEQQVGQLKSEVDAAEASVRDMTPEEAGAWQQQIARMQRAIESEEDAVDRIDTRIIDLENEILEGRRQLAEFEEFVLENLELGE